MNNPLNRSSLKALFDNGCRPDGDNFASLIESMVNKVDDGISKDQENGLILSPEGNNSRKLISFYENLQEDNADWVIKLSDGDNPGLSIAEPAADKPIDRLLFTKDGKSGINTDAPRTTFHVNGVLGTDSRVGTFNLSSIPADGQWYDIIIGIDDFSIFEIIAQAGTDKAHRHALLHSHVICRFNKSKIRSVQSYKAWFFWNKLALRFKGKDDPRILQLRSRRDYGPNVTIKFHIVKLWDNGINALFI